MTCAAQIRGSSSSNITILSQSSMDLTCMVSGPGSSVSSIMNRTILSSSDMDMTACATPNLPDPVPGIMITRPSTEDDVPQQEVFSAPNSHVNENAASTGDSQVKFSTAAFLKKIASGTLTDSSSGGVVNEWPAEDTKPKIDASQFLAKMTSGSSKPKQENCAT